MRRTPAPTIRDVLPLVISFVTAAMLTLFIVRSTARHALPLLRDHDLSGPQKRHALPVPRVGGAGILFGAIAGLMVLGADRGAEALWLTAGLMVCALPAFFAGLIEDLTKRVTPRRRLVAITLSAALAVALLDATIRRTEIPGLDWVVAFPIGAAIVTVFVVAGIANSINLIDGFNGLASMCVMLMLGALGYVAFGVGDGLIALMALSCAAAVGGFFVWNYPSGRIFLGDGGAYLLGFLVAELSVLLLMRNPGVSPLFPLLVCLYPVVETLFSIYRRRLLRERSAFEPDSIHLHSLIYRRLIRHAPAESSASALNRRNSMTAPYLWVVCALSVAPAVLFWDRTAVLAVCIAAFVTGYVVLYWRIVRFRAPRWMVLRP
jgi:UDP-N-acetylmuramyl pentapeptide phosphotransferase/UDP-N-acetylglucosamine-1-phosphate transferase